MVTRQAGFILTIELLLITTILVIGLSVGIVQVRDALIKRQKNQDSRQIIVVDDQNQPIGRAVGLDEHEAPLVAYLDRRGAENPENQTITGRAFLGIRDDRFTSREPVFYDAPNCTGNPCLKGVSDEAYNLSVGGIAHSGSVSYITALQGNINYAIGRAANNSVQGILMRSSPQMCPVNITQIRSVYLSQKVTSELPCESFSAPRLEADNSCLVGIDNIRGNLPLTDVANLPSTCETCPVGTESQSDLLDNYLPSVEVLVNQVLKELKLKINITLGELCCPENSQLSDEPGLVDALVFVVLEQTFKLLDIDLNSQPLILETLSALGIEPGEVYCVPDIQLNYADSVTVEGTNSINVLDQFEGPFKVAVPQQSASEWYHVPPNGEGNLYTQPNNE